MNNELTSKTVKMKVFLNSKKELSDDKLLLTKADIESISNLISDLHRENLKIRSKYESLKNKLDDIIGLLRIV